MLRLLAFSILSFLFLGITPASGKQGYIKAMNLNVYYITQGNGPAVVLLHGGYLDLHSWDKEAIKLASDYQVIRFDLPGHGKTTGIDTSLKIQDVIRILLDSLHIRRASFIGLSLGAACVVDFTLAYPTRVNKLVLTSAGLSGWPDVMQLDTLSRKLFTWWDSVFASKNHTVITEGFTHLWCDGPFRRPAEVAPAVRHYVYRTVAVNDLRGDETWPVFNVDRAAKRVHTINCPVLILAGDKDVPFILAVAHYLNGQISNSKLKIFKNTAHMVSLEKPLLFDRSVKAFLRT